MRIRLEPVNESNRYAVLALSVREDQPFVATNAVSLRQANEVNAEEPGAARPFAIYADERLVGFCMFSFAPDDDGEAVPPNPSRTYAAINRTRRNSRENVPSALNSQITKRRNPL